MCVGGLDFDSFAVVFLNDFRHQMCDLAQAPDTAFKPFSLFPPSLKAHAERLLSGAIPDWQPSTLLC